MTELIDYLGAVANREEGMLAWFIIFGIALAAITGLLPLVTGLVKKKKKLAIWGFVATFVPGSIMGFILGMPIAVFFTYLILKPEKDKTFEAEDEDEDLDDIELDEEDEEEK